MSETFGTLLRQYREAADLSQIQLSIHAGYDPSYVWKIENDKYRMSSRDSVLALAEVLELNTSQTDRLLYAAGHAPETDYQALYEADHGLIEDRRKWCGGCQKDLPTNHYSTDRSRRDSLFPYCQSCKADKWTAYSTRVALRGQRRSA